MKNTTFNDIIWDYNYHTRKTRLRIGHEDWAKCSP